LGKQNEILVVLGHARALNSGSRVVPDCLALGFRGNSLTMSIHLNNLTLTYQRHPAVHHITVTIPRGSLLAIVGPNGAGKSTLLNALSGNTPVSAGRIEGLTPSDVAYLPQQTQLDKSFPLNVEQLVVMGLWQRVGSGQSLNTKQHRLCKDAIASVGLDGFERRMIETLSGGQLQRALFARVLLQDQPVILLDEPFNAIDTKTVAELTLIIKQWHQAERTVLMVTHDLDHVRQHCPQTLLLARECIGYGPTQKVLTAENLTRAKQLCESFDDHAHWCERNAA
jgi:zinc/manganese transport system ATP-binding protein